GGVAAGVGGLRGGGEGGGRWAVGAAGGWRRSVRGGRLWAHVEEGGHALRGGFGGMVGFGTGIGILRRQLWAWPVAFASVVGFGPIVLLIAPIPSGVIAVGFVLFVADTVGLLALHRSYFEPR